MVLLGGLEVVVGGYILHRYHKNKNEKKRLIEDAQQRRHNTFPGTKPQSYPQQYQEQPMLLPQKYACYEPQSSYQPQFQPMLPQKYPCYEPQQQYQPQLQPRPHTAQPYVQTQSYHQPQPQPQTHTIPRRPLPQPTPQFQQQIQPLQRADSMATLSRMPIANGSRYRDSNPELPPPQQLSHTQSIPQQPFHYPYYNTGFSASYPSLEPPLSTLAGDDINRPSGRHSVDDNWEIYGQASPHVHFAPSTQLGEEGEDNPPPPYQP